MLPAKTSVWLVAFLLSAYGQVQGMLYEADMPIEMTECVQTLTDPSGNTSTVLTTQEDIHNHCLQQFMWKKDRIRWSDFNITEKDFDYIASLSKSLYRRARSKRQIGRPPFPPSGFRFRREYRRISPMERGALHRALNAMKANNGPYNMFANLHQGIVTTSAHSGPNFFGWHRVYLSLFEESLRRFNRRLSLPYWDSTLDNDMENPVNSIIWSPTFLGNGDGFVTSGPFANWPTPVGQLTRNIGGGSTLMRKEDIRRVLTRCRTRDISVPTAAVEFNLEIFHGGPHNWVGGQMSGLNTAAHDPVFFLHHAFIDYIWELFRIRQARFCGVNPETDYPPSMGLHAPGRPMDGLPPYRNIDGYRNYWTRFWYRYQRAPTCSRWRPFCGSPYLRCNIARGRCISVARRVSPGGPEAVGMAFSAAVTSNSPVAARARTQAASIPIGPRFRAPPAEPRTQDARMMAARFRRAAPFQSQQNSNQASVNVGNPTFLAPPSDGRTSDVLGRNIAKGVEGLDLNYGYENYFGQSAFSDPNPASLLPPVEFNKPVRNDLLRQPVENTFSINGHVDASQWVYVPIRVIHKKNIPNAKFQSQQMSASFPFASTSGCIQDDSGAIQVKVQSNGLNYAGTYTEYALINANLPMDSTIAYIAMKSPYNGTTTAMLMGVYGCGQMCQPYCQLSDRSSPSRYRPCAGAISLSAKDTNVFSQTYQQAVAKVWQEKQAGLLDSSDNIRVVLHCSLRDTSPWLFPKNSTTMMGLPN